MLILHPKVQLLLKDTFNYSNHDIDNYVLIYLEAVIDQIISDTILYLDKEHPEDLDKKVIEKLAENRKLATGNMKLITEIYTTVFQQISIYPDLAENIRKNIQLLDEEFSIIISSSLPSEAKLKLANIMVEDLELIEKQEHIITSQIENNNK